MTPLGTNNACCSTMLPASVSLTFHSSHAWPGTFISASNRRRREVTRVTLKKSTVSPTRRSIGCLLPLLTPTPPNSSSTNPLMAHNQSKANHPVSPPTDLIVHMTEFALRSVFSDRRSTRTLPPAHSGSLGSGRAGSLKLLASDQRVGISIS